MRIDADHRQGCLIVPEEQREQIESAKLKAMSSEQKQLYEEKRRLKVRAVDGWEREWDGCEGEWIEGAVSSRRVEATGSR